MDNERIILYHESNDPIIKVDATQAKISQLFIRA